MNREEFNQNFILLNAGYAYHNADWNWKNIKSPFARIHFVINGNAKIIREDGTYNLKINHMYLTQSYKKHSYICDDIFELFYIHIYEKINNNLSFFEMIDFPVEIKAEAIDIELIKRLININPDKKLIFFDPKKYDNLSTLAKNMVNKNSSLAIILETEAILKILISRFIANAGCKTKNIDMRILNVIKYIQQNLDTSINIEELSNVCFLSDDHFIRLFKKEMKTTPIQYINQKKMEQAQLYFLITDKRIKDIAFSVGYNNVSYFNRIFKKYTGVSPLAYRRKYQKE